MLKRKPPQARIRGGAGATTEAERLIRQYRAAVSAEERDGIELALLRLLKDSPAAAHLAVAEALTHAGRCPLRIARWLAHDGDPDVAAVILRNCPALPDRTISEMALCKGQAHLQAIASRENLPAHITQVLVRRGDHAVLEALARNRTAALAPHCRRRLLDRLAHLEARRVQSAGRPPAIFDSEFSAASRGVE